MSKGAKEKEKDESLMQYDCPPTHARLTKCVVMPGFQLGAYTAPIASAFSRSWGEWGEVVGEEKNVKRRKEGRRMIRLIAHSKYLVTVGVLEAGEGESAPIQHLPKVGGCSQSLRCTHIRDNFMFSRKKRVDRGWCRS